MLGQLFWSQTIVKLLFVILILCSPSLYIVVGRECETVLPFPVSSSVLNLTLHIHLLVPSSHLPFTLCVLFLLSSPPFPSDPSYCPSSLLLLTSPLVPSSHLPLTLCVLLVLSSSHLLPPSIPFLSFISFFILLLLLVSSCLLHLTLRTHLPVSGPES